MTNEVPTVASFYATDRGMVAACILSERLGMLWPAPSLKGLSLLGFGYAAPYLPLWTSTTSRCVHFMPRQIGSLRWPAGQPSLSCTAEEDSLPFADLSFDRVLLLHGLEVAGNAGRVLREVWRVLKDDGRLMVVTPNRRGLWAHAEMTPFGQGEPYSSGQIGRSLDRSLFRVLRRDAALYLPPVESSMLLRTAPLWEKVGRTTFPHFAGLVISEAAKEIYAPLPLGAVQRRRTIVTELA